jgi:hypothetical protein
VRQVQAPPGFIARPSLRCVLEIDQVTAQRVACPGRILPRDRHYATKTRWTITTPADQTIVLCSAACALDWLVKALPADLEADVATNVGTAENAA